jgi:hypothetical protein
MATLINARAPPAGMPSVTPATLFDHWSNYEAYHAETSTHQ